MARPIRVEFEGAVYHVMARGNERRAIFRSDDDRKLFLQTVGEMTSTPADGKLNIGNLSALVCKYWVSEEGRVG